MSEDSTGFNKIQKLPGMQDWLPEDHEYFTFIKKVVRHRCRQNGFRRMSVPILEFTELFERGVGDSTEAVSKELYRFTDRGDREIALRPELTAGICRSYIENGMKDWPQPVNVYDIANNFRYDRPQKGRFREFWQINIESIGEKDAALDADMIRLCHTILGDLGLLEKSKLFINTLGQPDERKQYEEDLTNFFMEKERHLSEEAKEILSKNPIRLLDSKDEDIQIIAEKAPKLIDNLSKESLEYFEKVKSYLDEIGVDYEVDTTLVRGLDYYTDTIFEFVSLEEEGKRQNSLGGGGRYDGLIEVLGGQPTPGVGFALGAERLIDLMKSQNLIVPNKDDIHVFVVQLGDQAKKKCFKLINDLRNHGVKTRYSVGTGSLKSQLRMADKLGADYSLIIGQIEARDGIVIVRNMEKSSQEQVDFESVVSHLEKLIGDSRLDFFDPGKDLKKVEPQPEQESEE